MIDWIFVALLQAVAGEPTPPAPGAETPALEQPASGAEPPADTSAAPDPAAPPAETQYREERVCERLEVSTGERMPRRRCRMVRVPIEPGETPPEGATPQ